ncbi:MAG: sensory box sensor histidine kinase [Dehalococcoides mccartyi]|uniref:PAS domain S-box protein n=1 Tax=Dehalococcoides mccartyi TaxID=61435 RepID=UPI00242EAFE0|nr:PAS domain S-box protein [Dehalococcoides mccartyi]MCF7634574.1 sensory box sensor histidine kinase [Dehalococcoides mccartyi]MEA2121924.1 Adaptive-response sensory-kinase SasA [Dehalococcoides mccartyi]
MKNQQSPPLFKDKYFTYVTGLSVLVIILGLYSVLSPQDFVQNANWKLFATMVETSTTIIIIAIATWRWGLKVSIIWVSSILIPGMLLMVGMDLFEPVIFFVMLLTLGAGSLVGLIINNHRRVISHEEELNQILSMIRDINHHITHIDNEEELMERVCERLVYAGRYQVAWIGYATPDQQTVEPRYHAASGQPSQLPAGECPAPHCLYLPGEPIQQAIKSRSLIVVPDIQTCPGDDICCQHCCSLLCSPIDFGDELLGVLCVYSNNPDVFGREEISLLREVSQDISLGVEKIRHRQELARTEIRLKEERDKAQLYLDIAGVIIVVLSENEIVLQINKRGCEILGYEYQEIVGRNWFESFVPGYRRLIKHSMYKQIISGKADLPERYMDVVLTKDGQEKVILWHSTAIRSQDGKLNSILYSGEDVTELKHIEEALRMSEEKYHTLFETMAQGAIYIDDKGIIIETNPAANTIFGRHESELLGTNIADPVWTYVQENGSIMPPEENPVITALKTGKAVRNVFMGIKNNLSGEVRWVNLFALPLFRLNQENSYMVYTTFTDISRLKNARDALTRSENRYRSIFETAASIIISFDQNGIINDCNMRVQEILGYTPAELVGMSFLEIVEEPFRHEVRRHIASLNRGEIIYNKDCRMLHKDGKYRDVMVNCSTLLDENGSVTNAICIISDITEQKQTHNALIASEEKIRGMFNGVNEGIIVMDTQGYITEVNQTILKMNNYTSKDQMIGRHGLEFIAPKDREEARAYLAQADSLNEVRNLELLCVRPDGTEYFCQISGAVLRDYSGEIQGIIILSADITEHKKLEQQLIMTDRMASVGELASGLAHEINNPLTGIVGFSELLLMNELEESVKEDVQTIHREALRAAEVVRNLLTFARQQTPTREAGDINLSIQKVLELRKHDHRINNIRCITELDPDLPRVMLDVFQIQQVLINIIINAEFFLRLKEHPQITIKTSRRKGYAVISISDNGPGISPENIKRIFDPFFTTKEVGKGTGLGLSICHGIIEEHHGRISAESTPGNGATFRIELPFADIKPASTADSISPSTD